jgi:hypothetical protein
LARFNLKLWTLNEHIRCKFSVGQILICVSSITYLYRVPCTHNMCIIYNQHLDGNSAKGITALIYSSNKRREEKKVHKIRMDPLKCIPYASTVIVTEPREREFRWNTFALFYKYWRFKARTMQTENHHKSRTVQRKDWNRRAALFIPNKTKNHRTTYSQMDARIRFKLHTQKPVNKRNKGKT